MSFRTGDHRVYVNMGLHLSEERLRNYFQQFGQVLDIYIPRHKQTNAALGYGFVTFEKREQVDRTLALQKHVIDEQQIGVNRAGPRPKYEDQEGTGAAPHGTGPRLYVGGVPQQLCEEDLKAHFGAWGKVTDVYFPPQKNGRRSSYCFVRFSAYSDAKRAYTESQRRIKGMDVEAINMAKDRMVNNMGELSEVAKDGGQAAVGSSIVARNRKIQSGRVGGVLQSPVAPTSVMGFNSAFVPVQNLNPNMSLGSMGGFHPILVNGAVSHTVLPVVQVEHSDAVAHGVNDQQNVPVPNGSLRPILNADPTLPITQFVAPNTMASNHFMAGVPPSANAGIVHFPITDSHGKVVPSVSVACGGTPATLAGAGPQSSPRLIPDSSYNNYQSQAGRMSGYSLRPGNYICTASPLLQNTAAPQAWAQGFKNDTGGGQKWVFREHAPAQPIGGNGPQRFHRFLKNDIGFAPY